MVNLVRLPRAMYCRSRNVPKDFVLVMGKQMVVQSSPSEEDSAPSVQPPHPKTGLVESVRSFSSDSDSSSPDSSEELESERCPEDPRSRTRQ